MNNKLKAFSLIELLVVITIIGILLAVAAPIYRNYRIKTEYLDMVNFMGQLKSQVISTYVETDAFPATLLNTTAGTDTAINNFKYAFEFHYNTNGTAAAWWGFRLTGLSDQTHIYMCVKPNTTSKTMEVYCGPWAGVATTEGATIKNYLPANCQDTSKTCAGY